MPRAKLYHEGQFEGRKVKPIVFLGRHPIEPADPDVSGFYQTILKLVFVYTQFQNPKTTRRIA
jgi:hypothetical protein